MNTQRVGIVALAALLGLAGALGAAHSQEATPSPGPSLPTGLQPLSTPALPGVEAPHPRVVILDYHTFLGTHESGIDFSLEELASQLDAIAALGWKFVTLQDALAGKVEGRNNVVITIDDGNHTVYRAFKEVFEPRGIKPFLFIYPAIILGGVSYALTPAQVQELAQAGCGIGAHGYHHNPVTDKAWAKDPKDFMTEIRRPGPALEKLLGVRPTCFGYPFGVYSTRAEEALGQNGYAWGFAADDKVVAVELDDPGLDHFAVPRTIVYRWNRPLVLKALAAGARLTQAGKAEAGVTHP